MLLVPKVPLHYTESTAMVSGRVIVAPDKHARRPVWRLELHYMHVYAIMLTGACVSSYNCGCAHT